MVMILVRVHGYTWECKKSVEERTLLFVYVLVVFQRQMDPKNQSDFSLLMFCQHFCRILHLIQDANKQYVQCWDMPRRAQCFSELTSSNRRKMSVSHNSRGQSIVWCGTQSIFYSIPMFGALPLWNILKMPAEAARQRTKPSKKIIAFIDFNTSLCFWLFSAHCLQVSVISVNFTWDP